MQSMQAGGCIATSRLRTYLTSKLIPSMPPFVTPGSYVWRRPASLKPWQHRYSFLQKYNLIKDTSAIRVSTSGCSATRSFGSGFRRSRRRTKERRCEKNSKEPSFCALLGKMLSWMRRLGPLQIKHSLFLVGIA